MKARLADTEKTFIARYWLGVPRPLNKYMCNEGRKLFNAIKNSRARCPELGSNDLEIRHAS
jgi:hypothetical protein